MYPGLDAGLLVAVMTPLAQAAPVTVARDSVFISLAKELSVALVGIDEVRLSDAEDPVRRVALTKRIARIYEEQNLGINLEDAMMGMTKRVPNLDLRFFVTSVMIQRQTGGDLAEILDRIGYVDIMAGVQKKALPARSSIWCGLVTHAAQAAAVHEQQRMACPCGNQPHVLNIHLLDFECTIRIYPNGWIAGGEGNVHSGKSIERGRASANMHAADLAHQQRGRGPCTHRFPTAWRGGGQFPLRW